MFRLTITLPVTPLYGLDALDTRRRLELPDAAELNFRGRAQTVSVPERFARNHPDIYTTLTHAEADAFAADLIPGDLEPRAYDAGEIALTLTPKRAMLIAEASWARLAAERAILAAQELADRLDAEAAADADAA